MSTTKLLMAAALLVSMAACKKDDETKLTLQDKLIGKVWKSTAFSNTGVPSTKWCDLNSLFEYTETGTVYVTKGDNQGACSGPAIGEIYTYKYITSADDKYLIRVTPWPDAADTFEIVSISSDVLKTNRYVNGGGEVWEDTYTAQ